MKVAQTLALAAMGLTAAMAGLTSASGRGEPAARAQTSPTPYHEGQPSPAASPSTMLPTVLPLPEPSDRPTADMMAKAGAAMAAAAAAMDGAAAVMVDSDDRELVELAGHWRQDAQALRERADWMVTTATSSGMVHDPDQAREVDVWNLKAGGVAMAAEGEAMVAHGQEMQTRTAQLREQGGLAPDLADDLTAAGQALVETGEALAQDGERMERYADGLIRSLGLQP